MKVEIHVCFAFVHLMLDFLAHKVKMQKKHIHIFLGVDLVDKGLKPFILSTAFIQKFQYYILTDAA